MVPPMGVRWELILAASLEQRWDQERGCHPVRAYFPLHTLPMIPSGSRTPVFPGHDGRP